MPGLVVNLVTETGGINNSQRDAGSLLIKLQLCSKVKNNRLAIGYNPSCVVYVVLTDGDGLDADTLLQVGVLRIISVLALQNLLAAESVDKSCAT